MRKTKEDLNLEKGLKEEWLITNGLGGFASSTIIGANTRKYHGLLIAPLTPPARRYLILSKLDESIIIANKKYDLFTNIGEDYITHGYKYQTEFEKDIFPKFTYQVENVKLEKTVCMEKGKECVGVLYRVENKGNTTATLTLAPIINFRDFHTMSTNHYFGLRQMINGTKVKVIIDQKSDFPVYFNLSEGRYIEHYNDTFRDMFYIEEQKRGFYPKENHGVTGVFEVEIAPGETKDIHFICGFEENIEEIKLDKVIEKEKARIKKIEQNTGLLDNGKNSKVETQKQENSISKVDNKKQTLIKELIDTADQFVVFRPSFGLHTLIAGYPWFLDWGRDSLISFEGLLLKTKRFDMARELLLTMVRDIKYGLVPNGYSGFDNRPLYNSADSSLLLFEEVQKYLNYTDDMHFVKENLFEKMETVIESYQKRIDVDNNNIYLDDDYLISSGGPDTQNTWMDAKTNGIAATPRNGKAVEINSLWYNSLLIMADLTEKLSAELIAENKYTKDELQKKIRRYKDLAKKCKKSFKTEFYNPKRKCLYDVVGDGRIRPNQLFALSLTYPVIDPNSDIGYNIVNTVEKKLLNNYGLKTLAKGEPNYVEIYEGDPFKRDMSYHQGITWPWLLGLYYDSLRNMVKAERRKTYKVKLQEKLDAFVDKTTKTFESEVEDRGCLGSIAEIYDSVKPFEPKGAISQAWSVAEVLRIITN